jgi:altronate dehydratase
MTQPPRMLTLHPQDNVAIALGNIDAGDVGFAGGPVLLQAMKQGHKCALLPIAAGQNVIRYGQTIGQATADIVPGEHVHTQNLGMGEHSRDYAHASEATALVSATDTRTFNGYHRADGRVGTRNYLGILTSVNCSGSVAKFIAVCPATTKATRRCSAPCRATPSIRTLAASC